MVEERMLNSNVYFVKKIWQLFSILHCVDCCCIDWVCFSFTRLEGLIKIIKIIAMCQFLGWLMVPCDWFFKQFCFQFKWENGPFISQLTIIHWNLQMQPAAFLHWVEYVYEAVINMMNGGHSLCMQISRLSLLFQCSCLLCNSASFILCINWKF